jgi:hypothetical protein
MHERSNWKRENRSLIAQHDSKCVSVHLILWLLGPCKQITNWSSIKYRISTQAVNSWNFIPDCIYNSDSNCVCERERVNTQELWWQPLFYCTTCVCKRGREWARKLMKPLLPQSPGHDTRPKDENGNIPNRPLSFSILWYRFRISSNIKICHFQLVSQ